MPPVNYAPLSEASDVLPLLTPVVNCNPDTLPSIQHQPTLPPPQASPKIKPPPGTGSQSLRQSSLPLWQMFGSAFNTPAVMANMVTGGESLDLDILAKAAVSKRKEQECQSAEAAARDSVIAELHRRAARQAALSAAAQQHAVNWLQAPMDADDADYVKHHVDIVQTLLAQANLLQPVTSGKVKPAADIAAAGKATIIAAAKAAAAEQAAGLATAATISDPVAAASAKAAAVDRAAAVVTAAVTSASAAEATANSAAAVAALQAAAADGAAPAAAVALAVDEAARALAAAKAKATATAEAALRAAVAQEKQRVVKKANTQLFVPLNQALGGLVDYPSDDDSHMSRALTGSQNLAQPSKGEAEVSSAERRALAAAAAQQHLSDRLNPAQAGQGSAHQPASWLPMYSMDPSSSHQQASSGAAGGDGDLEADATGGTPKAAHSSDGTGLAGAVLPCSRLSGQQLGEVLDSLRELGSVHMNLSLLSGTGVLAFVDCVRQSPEASVAYMADMISRQWRRSLASHLYTVTQPWPNRNLAQETAQLLEQCASRWALPLPPPPEATPAAPIQAYASGNKKKRKRDGWDSKKGSKTSAALLRASGSAPEAQTLHQLSKAKQDESLEARRLKRDLQTLHNDPSTLSPTPSPQAAATAATITLSEQAAQQTSGVAPATESQLQAAGALVNPDQPVASTAADRAAAAVTAVEGSAPADSTHADKPSAVSVVNDADVAEPEVGNDVPHADGSEAVAADEDAVVPQAINITQHSSEGSKMPDASKHEQSPAVAVLPLDKQVTDRQTEGDIHDHNNEQAQLPGASDATRTETAIQQPAEDELQEEPQQSKRVAPAKPKGKRKAVASLKGTAKRQKGKQDNREASPAAPDTAAGKTAAPSQQEDAAAAAPVRPAAAAKPAASKAQSVAAEAAATKQGGRTVKKGASSASGAGIKKAAAKPSAAATKTGGTATSGAKRKARAAALASDSDADDTENDKADHSADDAPDAAGQAVEAAAAEADEAVAAPSVPRDRRNKAKEPKLPPAPQPAQAVKRATKQQKLPFTKVAPISPKSGKAGVTATATSAAAAASAGSGSKTGKGKASDKKSGASSEPASSAKEPKGKQVKSSPKAAAPSKQQKTSGKQQKPKAAAGKDTKAAAAPEESATDGDESEADGEAGPSSKELAKDTPVCRAVSYLKQQQQRLSEGSYTQLKPVALATSKGTLQRLSKLPGWNRQSARKKHYASCDAALQAAVSRHKGDCADVTKKRAKKEVLRLAADLVTAVEDLAT